MDVFSDKIYEIDDTCYFIMSNVDNPYLYLRCKGVVKHKKVFKDVITYFVKLVEVCESKETIKAWLHRKNYRIWHINADRGDIVQLSCFDNLLNWSTFQQTFSKKMSKYLIPCPSVFVYETFDEMTLSTVKTLSIMKIELQHMQEIIQNRELAIKLEH